MTQMFLFADHKTIKRYFFFFLIDFLDISEVLINSWGTWEYYLIKLKKNNHSLKEYPSVTVIGAGLAGSEAAWQIASAGIKVTLFEMRPKKKSPAHHSSEFAELVCSNSFGALSSDRAAGLLQEELRTLKSIVINKADKHSVPAGGALAVDRSQFSLSITCLLYTSPSPRD